MKIIEKMWHIPFLIIFIVIGFYLVIVIRFYIMQSKLVYFPEKEIKTSPNEVNLSFESVSFKTKDGFTLSGWFIPFKDSRYTILFCHGNAGNISDRLESIKVFHNLGLNVFIFDYRGYGKSEGAPREQGTYLDAQAAWDYLIKDKNIDPKNIIIFGRSLGASIAAHLAKDNKPSALIIESAFTSIKELGAEFYPYLPVKLLSRFKYDTISYIKEVNCPILIIHSLDDEVVPFRHGRLLFEAANEPKKILKISGTHSEGFITSKEIYNKTIKSFIKEYL